MFGYYYGVLHRSSSQFLYIIATISTDSLYAHASTRAIDSIASNRSTNSQSLFNGRLCETTEAIYEPIRNLFSTGAFARQLQYTNQFAIYFQRTPLRDNCNILTNSQSIFNGRLCETTTIYEPIRNLYSTGDFARQLQYMNQFAISIQRVTLRDN